MSRKEWLWNPCTFLIARSNLWTVHHDGLLYDNFVHGLREILVHQNEADTEVGQRFISSMGNMEILLSHLQLIIDV